MSQKPYPREFWRPALFETEVIKEKVIFEMPAEAHNLPFLKNAINSEMLGVRGLYFQVLHISMIPTTGENFLKSTR